MSEIKMKQPLQNDLRPYIRIRDPISALTHFIGFVAAIFLLPPLLIKAAVRGSDISSMIGLSIYGLSLIVLYGASSAHHSFILPERGTTILKRFDHIAIFYLIAGTYTPLCLTLMKDTQGKFLLTAVWIAAVIGTLIKFFFVYCPKYVSSILYIVMGWFALFRIVTLYHLLGVYGFFWLLAGGIFYTIGGVLYALKIRISDRWSEHEVFHILVLLGSLCHYVLIFCCTI